MDETYKCIFTLLTNYSSRSKRNKACLLSNYVYNRKISVVTEMFWRGGGSLAIYTGTIYSPPNSACFEFQHVMFVLNMIFSRMLDIHKTRARFFNRKASRHEQCFLFTIVFNSCFAQLVPERSTSSCECGHHRFFFLFARSSAQSQKLLIRFRLC